MGQSSPVRWCKLAAAGFVLAFVASACSHTSRITSNPEGAELFINGIYIGQTPTIYRSRSGTPDTYYVKLEKEGHKTLTNMTIDRVYRADISLILLPLLIPYWFTARLEDQYVFELQKIDGAGGAPPPTTRPAGPAPFPAMTAPAGFIPPPATAPPERLPAPSVPEPPPVTQ